MKKLKHIKLFESFEAVEKLDIPDIMANMPGYKHGGPMGPALRAILEMLDKSGAKFEIEYNEESRGSDLFMIIIRNTSNKYDIRLSKYISSMSGSPSGLKVGMYNGETVEDVFFIYTDDRGWHNENGLQIAKSAMDKRFFGATKHLPNPGGMQDGYELADGTSTSDGIAKVLRQSNLNNLRDNLYDLWASFGKAVYKKKSKNEKDGKNSYPRIAFTTYRVATPKNDDSQGSDIVEANRVLVDVVVNHNFWDMLTSNMSDTQANQKMADKLADTKIPMKDRLMNVIKYMKPLPDETLQRGTSNPWATTSTDKKRNVYDLGMMEDSPAEIQKEFDKITDAEWQKVANDVFGGDLMSIKVTKTYIQDSDKAKSETPNLFNQNKLQLVIEYNSTVYYN